MAVPAKTLFKATLLKAAIDKLTSDSCMLVQRQETGTVKIILTEKQRAWFQAFINAQLDIKRRPDVEIDVLGVLAPVLIKRLWPFLAAAGGGLAALVLGRSKGEDE